MGRFEEHPLTWGLITANVLIFILVFSLPNIEAVFNGLSFSWETKLHSHLPHLILEQLPKGFNQVQLHDLRKPSHIMMTLDGGGRPFKGNALNDIRIEGSLREVFDPSQLLGLFLKDLNEFSANNLSFFLGVGYTL